MMTGKNAAGEDVVVVLDDRPRCAQCGTLLAQTTIRLRRYCGTACRLEAMDDREESGPL